MNKWATRIWAIALISLIVGVGYAYYYYYTPVHPATTIRCIALDVNSPGVSVMVAGINIDVVDDVGKIQERVTTLDLASSPTITLVAGRVYNVTAWYWVPKSVQITVPLVFNPDTTQLVIDVALSAPPVGSTWWAIIDISLRVSAIW